MVGFLYIVGVVLSLIVGSYLDARGSKLLGIRGRVDGYSRDPIDVVPVFAGSFLWPLAVVVLAMVALYRGLIWIFSWEKKEPKAWRCPVHNEAFDYRAPVTRCDKRATSLQAPMCKVHKVTMVES